MIEAIQLLSLVLISTIGVLGFILGVLVVVDWLTGKVRY